MKVVMNASYGDVISEYNVVKNATYNTAIDVFEYVLGSKKKYFEDLGINYVAVRDDNNSIIRKVVVR